MQNTWVRFKDGIGACVPRSLKAVVGHLVVLGLVVQLCACGERSCTPSAGGRPGAGGDRLDPGVVVLEALGLLFLVIPGVIALAVDFSNGTIYLPGTASSDDAGAEQDFVAIRLDKKDASAREVEAALRAYLGKNVDLDGPGVVVRRVDSLPRAIAR